jgi:predicted transcriptional regulator of viral defense system
MIRRRPVIVHETRHPAKPATLRGEETRVSSIGRTFADMLSEPSLCGGMHHVIGIWEEEAEEWLDDIITAIDESSSKIVKVRAGYLLAERIGLQDARIDSWVQFAQRGGSRKLDPDAPYAPRFSETWMLSLND